MASFFTGLLALCRTRNFFSRATTQELLSELMVEFTASRSDGALCRELLRHDWLRCGHRFLPESLGGGGDLAGLREELARTMPANLPPHYDYQGRSDFFRKSLFLQMSGAALRLITLDSGDRPGIVVFRPEKAAGLHHFQKTSILPPT